MAKSRESARGVPGELTTDRFTRDDAIAAQYASRPSLRTLYESGRIDRGHSKEPSGSAPRARRSARSAT